MKTLLKRFKAEKFDKTSEGNMDEIEHTKETTLCIINDSVVMREGIKSILSSTQNINHIITTSKDDYFDIHATKNIDIIVTDIEFGKDIDPTFIKQIKAISPATEIIVYTRIKNHTQRNESLDQGARFFIFWEDRFQLLEHVVERIILKVSKQKV